MQAEYLATWAIALACCGESEAAEEQARHAASLSQGVEAAVLAAAAVAIVSREETLEARAEELFAVAERTGNYDGLLFACRQSPRLARELDAEPHRHRMLSALVQDIGDNPLADRLGLSLPGAANVKGLTRRERQVYDLIALGLTNKEIAAKLFISESTAKVHSSRVRGKLGARSRTEVALHARTEKATPPQNPDPSDAPSEKA
jgi:DNA-binding NarL/FixJ family response regulator